MRKKEGKKASLSPSFSAFGKTLFYGDQKCPANQKEKEKGEGENKNVSCFHPFFPKFFFPPPFPNKNIAVSKNALLDKLFKAAFFSLSPLPSHQLPFCSRQNETVNYWEGRL